MVLIYINKYKLKYYRIMSSNSNTSFNNMNNLHFQNINNERASFYFKIAYTNDKAIFEIPTNICMANFIEYVNKSYLEY